MALVDCSKFSASRDRLFQPQFRGVTIMVHTHDDGRVIARSNEAKAIGIAW